MLFSLWKLEYIIFAQKRINSKLKKNINKRTIRMRAVLAQVQDSLPKNFTKWAKEKNNSEEVIEIKKRKKILSKRSIKKWSRILEGIVVVLAAGALIKPEILPSQLVSNKEIFFLLLGILIVGKGIKSGYKLLTNYLTLLRVN
jgi:hypothetical protein